MNAFALLVATATLGVDYGWHRANDGEWEYIIQIEPALVETLTNGQALVSQMPPELRGVRRFRIQIGQGEVPREQLPLGGIPGAGGAADGLRPLANDGRDPRGSPLNNGWTHGSLPPEPGSAGQRNFDWLRQNPIHVDPLENSFLGDTRLRDSDRSRDFADAAPRFPNAPWPRLDNGFGNNGPGANGPAGGIPAGIGPEPAQFDAFNRGFNDDRFGASTPRMGLPTPRGGSAWDAPDEFNSRRTLEPPNEFSLPERPRIDLDDSAAARRLRLNENSSTAGRGFTASLPSPSGFDSGRKRSPTVSLSHPDRARLPGDGFDSSPDLHRTNGTTSAANGAGGRPSARAEITQHNANASAASAAAADKIWWPLTTTVLLLFGSIGGNIYLGWLAMDFYRRYRECAWELRTGN